MSTGEARPAVYSEATLHSLVCPVLLEARQLRACLGPETPLVLEPMEGVPEGLHPLIVEVWQVREGRIQVGELDAHQWWEVIYGSLGMGLGTGAGAAMGAGAGGWSGAGNGGAMGMPFGPLGAMMGAAMGAAVGSVLGAAAGAAERGREAAWMAAGEGRRTSVENSRVVGTYNEIIVTIPCSLEGAGYSYVAATYTDSPASIVGEWLVGWGYRKTAATGRYEEDGTLHVQSGVDDAAMRIRSRPAGPGSGAGVVGAGLRAVLSYPVLGVIGEKRLMMSFLDRKFESDSVCVTPATVEVTAGEGFIPGVGAFSAQQGGIGPASPWGAFLITGLPVVLSYPRPALF